MTALQYPAKVYTRPDRNDVEAQPQPQWKHEAVAPSQATSQNVAASMYSLLSMTAQTLTKLSIHTLISATHGSQGQNTDNAAKKAPEGTERQFSNARSSPTTEEVDEQPCGITVSEPAAQETNAQEQLGLAGFRSYLIKTLSEMFSRLKAPTYLGSKTAQAELLKAILEDKITTSRFVFLCWGSNNLCRVLVAVVPDSLDDLATWKLLRTCYYSHRGWWRQYLPFLSILSVDIVGVTIDEFLDNIKNKGSAIPSSFSARYEEGEDILSEKKRLVKEIESYCPQEDPCEYNDKTGRMECSLFCISRVTDTRYICPEWKLRSDQDDLQNLQDRPMLKHAFNQSDHTHLVDLLSREGLRYYHKNVGDACNPFTDLMPGRTYKALRIEETNILNSYSVDALVIPLVCIIIVMFLKLIGWDWATIWSAVGGLAAVFALYVSWSDSGKLEAKPC